MEYALSKAPGPSGQGHQEPPRRHQKCVFESHRSLLTLSSSACPAWLRADESTSTSHNRSCQVVKQAAPRTRNLGPRFPRPDSMARNAASQLKNSALRGSPPTRTSITGRSLICGISRSNNKPRRSCTARGLSGQAPEFLKPSSATVQSKLAPSTEAELSASNRGYSHVPTCRRSFRAGPANTAVTFGPAATP